MSDKKKGCCCGHEHEHAHEHECCGGHAHHEHDHECCGGHAHHHEHSHECGCGHHHSEFEGMPMPSEIQVETVTLVDEDGNDVDFYVVATLELEGTHYALLSEDEDASEGVLVFRLVEDEDEDTVYFEPLEDEDEVQEVLDTAHELLEDEDEDDDEAEGY